MGRMGERMQLLKRKTEDKVSSKRLDIRQKRIQRSAVVKEQEKEG